MNFIKIETVAAITNMIYVFGIAFHKRWCWYFACAGSILYTLVFFQSRLYAEAFLHLFYTGMAIQGWYLWSFSGKSEISIHYLPFVKAITHFLMLFPLSFATGWLFLKFTDASQPFLDATLSIFSMYATWLAVKKIIQNWLWWMVIDAISIGWFLHREMYPTALLYLVYTGTAVLGYVLWIREFNESKDKS